MSVSGLTTAVTHVTSAMASSSFRGNSLGIAGGAKAASQLADSVKTGSSNANLSIGASAVTGSGASQAYTLTLSKTSIAMNGGLLPPPPGR